MSNPLKKHPFPSKASVLAYLAENDLDVLVPFIDHKGGVSRLVVSDMASQGTLNAILVELKLLNTYMSVITGEDLNE